MGWLLLIGLICLLAVIGYFFTGRPFKFALGGIILLVAIAFVVLIVIVTWVFAAPCSAPFTDHSSAYCKNQTSTPTTSNPAQIVPIGQQTVTVTSSTGALPTLVGQCDSTTISQIGTRLTDGASGNPIPGTGSAIWYADGGRQVSYDTIQGVTDSQVGDRVNLCLISIPTNCPVGDNRGRVYQATNIRTGETWQAGDSEHSCGGA